tara:strand:- start:6746 stop:8251 length:1506 start_codon:yes stop_codon:yes gene_type:complete
MKKSLITLHTEDTNALFDNIFNDEIIIEPNSELAFHSCCLRLNNLALKINNDNKLVLLQIYPTPPMQYIIPSGQYGEHQVEYLLEGLQNGFNQQLNILNETDNGQQIRVLLSRQNVVSIELIKASIYLASDLATDGTYVKDTSLFLYGDSVVIDGTSGQISRSSGSTSLAGGLRQYIHGRVPITRGCGFCSVKVTELRSFDSNVMDGLILMITEEANPNKFETRTSCLAYLRVPEKVGHFYKYTTRELNHTEHITNIDCQINDVVQFEISEGKLFFTVYRTGVTIPYSQVLRGNFPAYNDTEIGDIAPALYMTAGIMGPSFSGILNYIPDAFLANTTKLSASLPDLTDDPPSFEKGDEYEHILTFQKDDIATAFGFDDKLIEVRSTDVCTFTAANSIVKANHPSNYKIEMLNIQLESFDSQKEGRMNILSTIPTSKEFRDNQLSVLNFEPANMFYLTIRNKQQLSLRNIRARVIDANNEPITLLGFSSLNLLIKPGEHNNQ